MEKGYPTEKEIRAFFAQDGSSCEKWISKYHRFIYLSRLIKHEFSISLNEKFEYQDLRRELRDLQKVIRDKHSKDGMLRSGKRRGSI